MNKAERLQLILRLVREHSIHSQAELQAKLRSCGVHVAQATLSRDMQTLRLEKKRPEEGGAYHFSEEPSPEDERAGFALWKSLRSRVRSVSVAGMLLVIKTQPAMAQPVGLALDAMALPGVMGTLAGDDTIFVAVSGPREVNLLHTQIQLLLHSEVQ